MRMEQIAAGILAGGRHTRMGVDKLLLRYKGKYFLEHIYDECNRFPEILVSVADKEQYAQFAYPFVEDEVKGYGPMEGIYQLLKCTNKEYVFVLAADMPLITADFLQSVISSHREEDCLVVATEDGLHPLCCIYAKRILPKLEKMRTEGVRKPRLLYEQCKVRYISAEELGYPDSVVQNVNTPEEYERLVTKSEIN